MIPRISLEQWATFKAVVDEGSFARAAEALNKSQSSVSYIIARLEEQLPTPALKQEGRKAVLTEAGKLLYRYASNLLAQAGEIEKLAGYLASGWETEITLAADALVPMDKLFCALHEFSLESPQTRIRILETTMSGTTEAILFRQADIVLTAEMVPGFLGVPLSTAHMRYIASPTHPLVQLGRPLYEDDLKQHRQIVIRDSGVKRTRDAGWLGAEQRWTVSHMASSIEAVKAGLGFASIPVELVHEELAAGEVVQLPLAVGGGRDLQLYLVKTAQSHAGPATEALATIIAKRLPPAIT